MNIAHILIKPLLPRRLRLTHHTLHPLIETGTVALVIRTLKLQPLMCQLRLSRLPPRPTAERPLVRQRRPAHGALPARTGVRTRAFERERPALERIQQAHLRLFALGQLAGSATFAPTPIRGALPFGPEEEAAQERAIAAGNVAPGSLAPAEDADVREAHEGLAEGGEQADGKDGVLGELVAVAHAVADEGDEPEEHVDDGVDEEDAQLALDRAAALAQGAVAD